MAMKLGEILIQKGSITESQLDAALKSQLILGGHLGTSLIEMGFIDEDTLGEVLSKVFKAPYAPAALFSNIAEPTINAVRQQVAEEYGVVPIRLTETAVHLAMVKCNDLRVLDELSFAIGRKIIPWIAAEVRIYQALEKYYGVWRRPRFITLGHQLDGDLEPTKSGTGNAEELRSDGASASGDIFSHDGHDVLFGYGKSWQEIAEELERRGSASPILEAQKPPAVPANTDGSLMSLPDLAARYCRSESRDDLARAALDFSTGRAGRILLLSVTGDRAGIWHERGLALTSEKRRSISIQVTSEALFRLPMGDDHFFGALPAGQDVHSFYRTLGVEAPQELLLIPVRVDDLLVAVALLDGGPHGRVHANVHEFLTAFRGLGLSFSLLATRRKIRDAMGAETRIAVAQ